MNMRLSKLWEIVKDWEDWRVAVHGVAKSRKQFSNWTTTIDIISNIRFFYPRKSTSKILFLENSQIRIRMFIAVLFTIANFKSEERK